MSNEDVLYLILTVWMTVLMLLNGRMIIEALVEKLYMGWGWWASVSVTLVGCTGMMIFSLCKFIGAL